MPSKSYQYFSLAVILVAANALFNSLSTAFGLGFPFTTFLFLPNDLFADFIKTALAFPGPSIDSASWQPIFQGYLQQNQYSSDLFSGDITNLHGMAFPTVIAILIRYLLHLLNPSLLWNLVSAIPILLLLSLVSRTTYPYTTLKRTLPCLLLFITSYPLLFAYTRGHLPSLLSSLLIVLMFHQVFQRSRNTLVYAILVAFAINTRPNIVILSIVPILLVSRFEIQRYLTQLLLLTASVYLISILALHYLYPPYTFSAFLQALQIYKVGYIENFAGLAYGSSFLTAATFILSKIGFGSLSPQLSILNLLLLISLVCYWCSICRKSQPSLVLALCSIFSIYALCSGVFSDYYLIPMVYLVIVAILNSSYIHLRDHKLTVVSMILLVSPKNYISIDGVSLQVFLNPVLLLAIVLLIRPDSHTSSYNSTA